MEVRSPGFRTDTIVSFFVVWFLEKSYNILASVYMRPRLSPRILCSCTLPWTDRFELDESLFRDVVRGQLTKGHTSIYLYGTAG